ncbi:MAG: TIGR00289 family protein [Thermoplasmata archaeon]|nr:MAG: TIGR00289 family protein [Thermoplasmata archaeon]
MRVAALFSGGKDSVYSIYITKQFGWDITHLVTILPRNKDSWMFHTVNIHLARKVAEAINIPHITRETKGVKEEELDDLKKILEKLEIDGVISGAISSEYQRTRIERVCHNLGLKSFTPIWHKNQTMLLKDQLKAGFKIIIVGVYADGFNETWLARTLDDKTIDEIVSLEEKYGINTAGEGGEYETLTLDGPIFKKKIVLDEYIKHWYRESGYLEVKKIHLEDKIV